MVHWHAFNWSHYYHHKKQQNGMIVTLSLPFETKSPGWKAQQLKGKMRKKQLCKQWTADHLSSFSPSSRRLSFWSIFLQIFSPNFRHLKKRTAKKEQCLLLTPPFCQSPRPRSTRVFNCGTAKLKVAMTEKRPGTFGVCVLTGQWTFAGPIFHSWHWRGRRE